MATVVEPILPREGIAAARHQPLAALLCAAVAGIVADRYWPRPFVTWLLAASVALAVWWILFRWRKDRAALAVIALATALAFAAWHHGWWQLYPAAEVGRGATADIMPVVLRATAITGVRWSPAPPADPLRIIPQGDQTHLTVEVTAVRDGDRWRPASGRASLTVPGHLLGVYSGDELEVLAHMYRTPPAVNPGEFDAALHERVNRQLVRIVAPSPDCVRVVERGSKWNPRRRLQGARDACNAMLWDRIAPSRAALASGLLVGSREMIDYEQTQQFFLTGTIHLLAISGVHVGILAYGFWLVMRTGLLGRRSAIGAAIGFVAIYALLTDAQSPVVRSAILVIVVCIGRMLARPAPPLNALAAGGLVVLAWNPTQFFQIGTQLSFLAVGTLIYCGPLLVVRPPADKLDRFLAAHRPRYVRWLRSGASYVWRLWLTGTVVWLVLLPLTMYHFHLLSPSALWLNPLLWLPITFALYSGFAALTIGWLLPPVGVACGKLCDGCLWIIDEFIRAGERSPLSYFYVPGPALWWVIAFYIALAAYAAFPAWRVPRRWAIAILLGWIALGHATAERSPLKPLLANKTPELRCTFIAVGHGTSALIELPSGQTILYDAGHMGSPIAAAQTVSAVLWSRGITHLDAVVISHADADHYNALPELLKRFDVGVIYVSPVMFREEPPGVRRLRRAIEHSGVPLVHLHGGQRLNVGPGAVCEALHPPRRGTLGSDNSNSIVLSLEFAGQRLLLPGDLETPGLDAVLAELPLDCAVVMAPHHGSARSNPRGFAEWSRPEWVVISGSRSRDATEVVDAYRSYGADVLHTAHDGAVRVSLSSDGTRIHSWHDYEWHERRHHGGELATNASPRSPRNEIRE